MIENYAQWVIRWRWLLIVGSIVIVLLAGSGVRLLEFHNNYRMFFSEDNPQLIAFENLQDTYTKNDNVLLVLEPKSGSVFTHGLLSVIEKITEQAWQIPYSNRVDSITNFQYTYADGDDLIVEDLVRNAQDLNDVDLARIKAAALAEPLLERRLVSPQADVTGVNVTIQLPGESLTEVPEVAGFVQKMVEELRANHPQIRFYVTGMVIMNNTFPTAAKNDMRTLVPLMLLVVILALGLLLRTITGTIVTLLLILFSIVGAMGMAGWLHIPLSPPATAAATIILTLAVADCVHLLSTLYYHMRHGRSKQEAIVESLRINFQPVFLTSLTTAIGFLTMNFSDAPPFRNLGNITAMGVTWAFIFSVSLLPALMMVLPVRVKLRDADRIHPMDSFAEFVIRRRKLLFWGMGSVILLLLLFIPKNELNDEFVKYFDTTVPFRADTDFTSERLTGIYDIHFSLGAADSGGVSDPAFLRLVEAFAQWLREQPHVMHVYSITDIMKRLNKNLHADDPAMYRLPAERELAAQYLLLYEMSLPYGLDLNDRINVDKSATRLTVTLENISSNSILALESQAGEWLRENTPEFMHTEGSSPIYMFANIGKRNIISMLRGTFVALVFISLILILALRSIKLGLLSLVPNLAPIAMAFGLWGLFVGEIGLALSVVGSMTLGIVVDDTIHFLSKYRRARNENGLRSADAVRYAFSTVGTALWVTTLVLVVGFSILMLSTFKLNSGMGMLAATAIALALIVDFLFLPALLMKFEEKPDETNIADRPVEPAIT